MFGGFAFRKRVGQCGDGDVTAEAFVEPDGVDDGSHLPVEWKITGAIRAFWDPGMRHVMGVAEAIAFFVPRGTCLGHDVVGVHEESAAFEMLHAEVVDVRRRERLEIFDDDGVVRERRGAEIGGNFVERVACERGVDGNVGVAFGVEGDEESVAAFGVSASRFVI